MVSATWSACLGALLFSAGLASAKGAPTVPGALISIDGLTPRYIQAMNDAQALKAPLGFSWFSQGALFSKIAYPIVTTLTAPSHVSTLSCTPPSMHGIIANSFIADGKKVSGFTHEVKTETLVTAARRQGKKVISIGYVSVDGQSERRSADIGLTYPDAKYVGANETLHWRWRDLPVASDWHVSTAVPGDMDMRESKLTLTINPHSQEKRQLNVLIQKIESSYRLTFDSDKDLTNGVVATLVASAILPDVTIVMFREENSSSPLVGFRRRVDLRAQVDDEQLTLFISGSSYNNAHPRSYREWLDAQGLVWPSKFATMEGRDPVAYVEEMALIDDFLEVVAAKTVATFPHDLVLFYQPLLDAVEHSYEAQLPKPFNPNAQDSVTQAYFRAITIVDENISTFVASMGESSAILLVGDHGMEPMKKTVNLAPIVRAESDVEVLTVGALVLIYGKGRSVESQAAAERYGAALSQALTNIRPLGTASLSSVSRRSTNSGPWQYGDAVWAMTAGEGIWFQWLPLSPTIVEDSKVMGMHGQANAIANMATGFYLKAPGLVPGDIGPMSLIDAVPTLTSVMGISPPQDCLGHSLSK